MSSLWLFIKRNWWLVSACHGLAFSLPGVSLKKQREDDRPKVLLRKGQLALPVFYFPPSLLTLLFLAKRKSLTCPHHLLWGPRPWVSVTGLTLLMRNQTSSWPRRSAPPPYLVHIWLPCLRPTIHSNSHHQLPDRVSPCPVFPDQKKFSSSFLWDRSLSSIIW